MPYITQLKFDTAQEFIENLEVPYGTSAFNHVFDQPIDYWYRVRTTENFNSTNDPAQVKVLFSDNVGQEMYVLKSLASKCFLPPIWVTDEEWQTKLSRREDKKELTSIILDDEYELTGLKPYHDLLYHQDKRP